MEKYFCIVATICLLFICQIWSKQNWTNQMIKFIWGILGIWGILVSLQAFGYVLRQ